MSEFKALDADKLRQQGSVVLERMARYWENLPSQRPKADVEAGYLMELLPKEAPLEAEDLQEVMEDFDKFVMPGVTHWHSVDFHAYFPTGNSWPAICADIISGALGVIGFSWESSPACTELEMVVMKWLGKLLGLPEFFYEGGKGGGIIQSTASEATLVALLSARSKSIKNNNVSDSNRMVVYYSSEAHSSVERATMILLVQGRKIDIDDKGRMDAKKLKKMIETDLTQGLIPIMCVATLGTTSICSFDQLDCIGPVCKQYDIWLHVDSAYAGSAFVCPEYRHFLKGIEYADSFNMNAHKWLMVNFDCSPFWFKDSSYMVETFRVEPLYLQHKNEEVISDYRHWQMALGRRFRSLKLWFVMRMVGVQGLRENIRRDVKLAKYFETLVRADDNFEVAKEVTMGLVCFRIKSDNEMTKKLSEEILKDGRLFMSPCQVADMFLLRMVICSSLSQQSNVDYAWKVIRELTDKLMRGKGQSSKAQ